MALLLLLWAGACRRVPPGERLEPLPVRNLTLAFHADQQGDLFFEVGLPPSGPAVDRVRWELWLSGRRFAEGLVLSPPTTAGVSGARVMRVEAPLVWRGLGWRDGATFLEVGLRGEVTWVGAPPEARRPFSHRTEVLLTGAPRLGDEAPSGR